MTEIRTPTPDVYSANVKKSEHSLGSNWKGNAQIDTNGKCINAVNMDFHNIV